MAGGETWTEVRFDSFQAGPYVAQPPMGVSFEVTRASLWIDLERLRASIGQRVRINGPTETVGVLRSFLYNAETDIARFVIEKDGSDEQR